MKRISIYAIAAFLFATAVTGLPLKALADTATTTVAWGDIKGGSTDDKHKDWSEVVTTLAMIESVVF